MREAAMAAFAKAGGGSKRRGWLAARFRTIQVCPKDHRDILRLR